MTATYTVQARHGNYGPWLSMGTFDTLKAARQEVALSASEFEMNMDDSSDIRIIDSNGNDIN